MSTLIKNIITGREQTLNPIQTLKKIQANKTGIAAIDMLIAGAVGLMVLALTVVVVLIILGQITGNTNGALTNYQQVANCGLNSTGGTGGTIAYTACNAAYNATVTTSQAVATVPTWFTIIITVVVAVGLITLVLVIRSISGGAHE